MIAPPYDDELELGLDDYLDADSGAPVLLEDGPACRVCGCTEGNACATQHGACFWLEPDLCSSCAGSA